LYTNFWSRVVSGIQETHKVLPNTNPNSGEWVYTGVTIFAFRRYPCATPVKNVKT
jgi:hypothetical protein